MLITGLQTLLTTPISLESQLGKRRSYVFWLGLSLAVSLGYAFLALEEPLSQPYVIQDDARQYLFWMQRSLDPYLFPNDLIANYFQSVTPLGYKALYGGAIALGIHPFQFNIILPAILGLIATQYLFRLTITILPIPFTAWMASVMFNQTLWMKDDLVSATPRAFVYPLFLAFLFYWVTFDQRQQFAPRHKGSQSTIIACVVALGLLGLFYPQYVLLAGAMLGIAMIADGTVIQWLGWIFNRSTSNSRQDKPTKPTPKPKTWLYLSAIATILIVILYYATTSSVYGPVVTLEQAKAMPEFWTGGRNFFFSPNLWWFYTVGDRSGFLHVGLVRPATLALGLFLPLILRFPKFFPLINAITPAIYRLGHLLLAATTLFLAAHLLLFRLHLPSRYTDHSLRIVMAIASALVLTLVLDACFNACRREQGSRGAGDWAGQNPKSKIQNPPTPSPSQEGDQAGQNPKSKIQNPPTPSPSQEGDRAGQNPKSKIQNPPTPSPSQEGDWSFQTPQLFNSLPKSKIQNLKSITVFAFTLFIFVLLLVYPQFVDPFPLTKYKVGRFPETYAFLRAQPKDSLVASVAKDADNIPIFAQRSILIGHEYAIPYHTGYYDEFRRRAIALLKAQYTTDREELVRFIDRYGVDFWLLEKDAYGDRYLNDHWIRQYAAQAGLIPGEKTSDSPLIEGNLKTLNSASQPFLQRLQKKCTVLQEGKLKLIDTRCLINNLD